MNVQLFISRDGQAVFACPDTFEKDVEHVCLDLQTGIITFIFKPDLEEQEMNCAVHEDICKILQKQLFCCIGYFEEDKLVASQYVKFSCKK